MPTKWMASLLALFAMVSGALAADRWTQYQGNVYHDGFIPLWYNWTQFQFKWEKDFPSTSNKFVVGGGGRLFLSQYKYADTCFVRALSEATGDTLWSFQVDPIATLNPPSYWNSRVYFTTGAQEHTRLTCLNAADGAILFREPFGAQWNGSLNPTLLNGKVYIHGGTYGGMYKFDAYTGLVSWYKPLNQYDEWTPSMYGPYAVAYLGEQYSGDPSAGLYVLWASTGKLAFRIPDPGFDWRGWSNNQAPTITKNNRAIVTNGERLVCFNLGTKVLEWQVPHYFKGQVAIANGKIYVVDDISISCRDEATGNLLWAWWWPTGDVTSPPIITHNLLFVSTANNTYAYNIHTRQLVWTYPRGGNLSLLEKTLIIASPERLTAIKVAP